MSTQTLNSIASKELYQQYSWYRNTFPPVIQEACDEFFLPGLKFEMFSLSKNINSFNDKDSYFVTKIRVSKDYDMFFRSSEKTISIILDKTLGKSGKIFKLNKMTDLEAKIITSFNDYMFNRTSEFITEPPINELRRTNFDMINITFLVKDEYNFGKFIVSLPQALLNPETIEPKTDKFDKTSFPKSIIDVNIKIGSTRFTMRDLKTLDIGDMVIFENSNTKKMTLVIDDYIKEINLSPNLGLITPVENNNGGNNMGADNLWDSIEVEMYAEFDAVKITLGDLKNIEEGNVVDLTSLYENKVTLRVEDKEIARGQLVIVNDRYGVKIDELIAAGTTQEPEEISDDDYVPTEEDSFEDNDTPPAEENVQNEDSSDDEFDYSDFELDDEDI